MRRPWLIVALIVVVLTLGLTGGAVMAQEDGEGGNSPVASFAARVAAILGLSETQVTDAFKQAATEMQDEAVEKRLDSLVESGKITQEQADEYQEWYQARPETLGPGMPFRGFGGKGFMRGGPGMMRGGGMMGGGMMWGGPGGHGADCGQHVAPEPTPEGTDSTSL